RRRVRARPPPPVAAAARGPGHPHAAGGRRRPAQAVPGALRRPVRGTARGGRSRPRGRGVPRAAGRPPGRHGRGEGVARPRRRPLARRGAGTGPRGRHVRVGVIGICGFGRFHAEAFAELGWTVAAGADRSPELASVAARFGAEPHRDYRDLLARGDLDAVTVSLPPRLHPAVVTASLEAGLPVLCEKPVAPSAAEAEALLAAVGA